MGFKILATYVTFTLITNIPLHAQKDWQFAKEKNGIKVYTKYYKEAGLKQLKVETTFTGVTLHQCFALFKDVDAAPQWTARLKRAKSLHIYSTTDYINYFEIGVPWPLKNRDAIFRVHVEYDKNEHLLKIISRVLPDYPLKNDTCVRIVEAEGEWRFTKIDNDHIKVQTKLFADPKGFPAWLVNLFVTDGPLQTLAQFRELVQSEKYKHTHFDFINDQ